jgi:hypothetical protein
MGHGQHVTLTGAQAPVGLKYNCQSPTHLILAPNSKQATPTAFDPCTLAAVPTMDFCDTPDLLRPARGRCTDALTPSK